MPAPRQPRLACAVQRAPRHQPNLSGARWLVGRIGRRSPAWRARWRPAAAAASRGAGDADSSAQRGLPGRARRGAAVELEGVGRHSAALSAGAIGPGYVMHPAAAAGGRGDQIGALRLDPALGGAVEAAGDGQQVSLPERWGHHDRRAGVKAASARRAWGALAVRRVCRARFLAARGLAADAGRAASRSHTGQPTLLLGPRRGWAGLPSLIVRLLGASVTDGAVGGVDLGPRRTSRWSSQRIWDQRRWAPGGSSAASRPAAGAL